MLAIRSPTTAAFCCDGRALEISLILYPWLADTDPMTDETDSHIPGHHHVAGTDLEVVFNRQGDDLMQCGNKKGVQVYRRCWLMPARI
jgi:hypothetical protein